MRLHIIGIPSSGKTMLGMGMSTLLGVPHHDLDLIAFIDERWTLRPEQDRNALIAGILEEPGFVTGGGFLGWTEPLFSSADHIVWLDPPLRVLVWRHILRHGRHPRWLPSLLRFQVLMYVRPAGEGPAKDDPEQTRAGIEIALKPWAYKVSRFTRSVTPEQVAKELLGRPPSGT